jgi:succinoglycan biosynthesis protein ExoW
MIKTSIIIPYFQREIGILRRALESILAQNLLPDISVDIIVVDDGSPISAQSETKGMVFSSPFYLNIIKQPNGGVALARNTALKAVNKATKYIAFLDSDDTWHEGHLKKGIETLEQGNDFYFCDNKRDDHHDSYFKNSPILKSYINRNSSNSNIITITTNELCTTILREFTTQASTVIYLQSIAPDLLFDTSFINAGEDIIFFLQLSSKVKNISFLHEIMVDCGKGINLYFGSLGWDNPAHLAQVITNLKTHNTIKNQTVLSKDNTLWNNAHIKSLKCNIAFLTLRQFFKTKGKVPDEIKKLAREDKTFYRWFPVCLIQVLVGRVLGIYKPD